MNLEKVEVELQEQLANLAIMLLFKKIDDLKNIQNELLDKEAKLLTEYNVGLTTAEAAKYLHVNKDKILRMLKEGVLEWRIFGEGDQHLRGKNLISIESLLNYKKQLWSKEFRHDGYFTNVQALLDKARRVDEKEARRMGVIE